MGKKSFPILINTIKTSSIKIGVPPEIYKFIDNREQIELKVSSIKKEVACYEINIKNLIEVPGHIAKELCISHKMITNLFLNNNQLCLGPVTGVFVSNGKVRKAKKQHPHFRLVEMAKANKEIKAILYFFSIKDVDFFNQRIYGTYLERKTDRFEEKIFPYPDVLYDRGGGTLRSQKKLSQKIREEIDKKSNPLKINAKYFFDKWDLYKNLSKYKEISTYLPKTILYESQYDLSAMLKTYSTIYIKDCLGHNSVGVARVKRLSNDAIKSNLFPVFFSHLFSQQSLSNKFELHFFKKEVFNKTFSSFDELLRKINNLFSKNKAIIQAGIDMIEVDNCIVDMRAEVQRNAGGKIEIGPYIARKGDNNSHVTSTSSGGLVYLFDELFKNHLNFPDEVIYELKERIETFLLKTFNIIEESYGNFGDVGIDFAVDKNLKIWFIECNAKPGKDTIYITCDDYTIQKSFSYPLNYGKFLWENREGRRR